MKNKTDLFERYLQAVRKYLPWKGQDDILNELRANLEAQLEEREEELGRPLTGDEMAEWLKHLGSPMHVAARYQLQQYLIGPAIFPMYWWVLRMAFLWAAIIYTIISSIAIVSGNANVQAVVEAMLRLPGVLISVATWVTLIFALLEFLSSRYPHLCLPGADRFPDWSPAGLPPLEKTPVGGKRPRSYAHAVAEVIFGYIMLVWLVLVPHHPYLLMGPGAFYLQASPFHLAHVWWAFYWLVLALNVVQVSWNAYRLWRGSWQDANTVQNLVVKSMGLLPLVLLLTAPDHVYIVLKRPAADAIQYGSTLDTINFAIWHGVQIMGLIIVLQLIWEIGKAGMVVYRGRTLAL